MENGLWKAVRSFTSSHQTFFHENDCLADCFQCVYDLRLVREFKIHGLDLWKAILISWGIAFFEYCFMMPAIVWVM